MCKFCKMENGHEEIVLRWYRKRGVGLGGEWARREIQMEGHWYLTSFSPSSLRFNLQIPLIRRRHLKMLCRAALSPLVRSPGWCFVLPPHAIAAISRLCMYERKAHISKMLVSMCLSMPMLFPFCWKENHLINIIQNLQLWTVAEALLPQCYFFSLTQ